MGDAALLVELGDEIDERLNARVHALAAQLATAPGLECIPGYASLLVEFDPDILSQEKLETAIAHALEQPMAAAQAKPRVVEIPTRYGGEWGPDLDFVARRNGLTPAQVVEIHTRCPLRVFMLGFTPGFPYIGPLPAKIAAPRLETPHTHVPAGAVGIAGRQTGIYPRESPGGWQIIGHTDLILFDPTRDPPTLLAPGDYVRFVAVDR